MLNLYTTFKLVPGAKFHCPSAGAIDFMSIHNSRFYKGFDREKVKLFTPTGQSPYNFVNFER